MFARILWINVLMLSALFMLDNITSSLSAQNNSSPRASLNWDKQSGERLLADERSDDNLWVGKDALSASLQNSLAYLNSDKAVTDYQRISIAGVNRQAIIASLEKFVEILNSSGDYQSFTQAINNNFNLIRPNPNQLSKSVKFTGYFQPTYQASRTRTEKFKYPIYKKPEDFSDWPKPHPKRIFLEGYEGLGNPVSPLSGGELAFLASRWEAFMIHVQGSAILSLADGGQMAVGFAGATDYPFKGVSKSFLQEHNIGWNKLAGFFALNQDLLNQVLVRNNRFILFKENPYPEPIGSLGVPVIAERSIATDKSLMPPGALSVVSTQLPYINMDGQITTKQAMRFVLDQDTGSAIKGTNRVDIFMGTGPLGQKKANAVFAQGEMYYLLVKSEKGEGGPDSSL